MTDGSNMTPTEIVLAQMREINQLRAEIERLRDGREWRDMASTPKAREWVLVARKYNSLPLLARWDKNYRCFENQAGDHIYILTHWRPLPRIPGNEGEK
jgi:hypothetical protein